MVDSAQKLFREVHMNSTMLGLQLLIMSFALPIAYHLVRLAYIGRQLADGHCNRGLLLDHKRGIWTCTGWLMVFLVSLVLMLVVSTSHVNQHPVLYTIHRICAVLFVALFLTLRFKTGVTNPFFHRIAGYSALVLYAVTLALGVYQLSAY